MALPEWGDSYNALYVPLRAGWRCALVPARDIEAVDRGWQLSYEERRKARTERDEQIDQDRRDFAQLFRIGIARKASRTSDDFKAYADFISKHVRGRWPAPIDGDGITRILREAVRDGLIVPAIDRNWRGSRGVSKRYAPQTWGAISRGGGSEALASTPRAKTFHQSVMESMGLDADGATDYIVKYNAMVERIDAVLAANAAKRAAANLSDDLIGAGTAIAETELGGGHDPEVGNTSTALNNAQAFEYRPGMPDGDAGQIAGMPFNGEPGTWISSLPGTMPQMRQYGANGRPLTDFDFEAHHGNPNPHAHNWDGHVRDEGAPVSVLPW